MFNFNQIQLKTTLTKFRQQTFFTYFLMENFVHASKSTVPWLELCSGCTSCRPHAVIETLFLTIISSEVLLMTTLMQQMFALGWFKRAAAKKVMNIFFVVQLLGRRTVGVCACDSGDFNGFCISLAFSPGR